MNVWTLVVSIIIFTIVAALLGVAIKCLVVDDFTGMVLEIILVICLFFLYITGQF